MIRILDEFAVKVCEVCGVDPHTVRRVTLDLEVGQPAVATIERYVIEEGPLVDVRWESLKFVQADES